MTRTNLTKIDRNPRVGDFVRDGRATAEISEIGRGEIQIEYEDGATIWLQRNRFEFDNETCGWRVV